MAFAGSVIISIYFGRKTKKYADRRERADEQVRKIDENSFDESDTAFAYEVVDTLDDSGIDLIHRMNEKLP